MRAALSTDNMVRWRRWPAPASACTSVRLLVPLMRPPAAVLPSMRAQVGLLYIHDPACPPGKHAGAAARLCDAFGGRYEMGVFRLRKPGGTQGDLLEGEAAVQQQQGQQEGQQLVQEEQQVGQQQGQQQQGQGQQQEGQPQGGGGCSGVVTADEVPHDERSPACRLLSYWEYLEQQEAQEQAQAQGQQEGA